MTKHAPADTLASRTSRIRGVGTLLVVALALALLTFPRGSEGLREAWFDAYQRLHPRVVDATPATIVEIDARSLGAIGRWPWPRATLAELVARIGAHQPAALGLDILMPEPDLRDREAPARETLPGNDERLARALADVPAVLAIAGMPEITGITVRAPPISVQGTSDPSALALLRFGGALGSMELLSSAASGWGLVSVDADGGVVRRVPLVADVGGTIVGAFAIELFRVAARERALRLVAEGNAVRGIVLGRSLIATADDGHVRIHFSRRAAERFVSAVDVLQGRADPARFRGRLVIVAATGLGLGDYHATPVGERMPGAEIHAQLIEGLYENTLLDRPVWAPLVEATALLLLGLFLVWATPIWKPRNAAALAIACVGATIVAGYLAFVTSRLLFDAATPSIALAALFTVLMAMTLAEANRHRRALERVVQRQREHAARVAGELDAARSIQLAMLPRADLLADDPRVDIAASMLPAFFPVASAVSICAMRAAVS